MKRLPRFFNLSRRGLIVLTSLLLLSLPATAAAEYVSIQRDKVNIRSGPSTDHAIVWEVFRGFPLQILERRGEWARVSDFENDQGWIYIPLVSNTKTLIVRVNTANMRGGPGTNHEVIASVRYGVIFEPLERRGDWIRVRHSDGATGWISASLLWPADII
ncbi:SH3 domain-containing protein [Desulfurivibrio sp. C05AmB]|uniref:SH3 domain-containing protein n=1 Tax=Desulfurivibrio sp. C05AmB TaxID=3374371 RepID=UPI00376F42A1